MIPGESGDSGHNPGLDEGENSCFINHSRTISRRRKNVAADLDSGLIMGDFHEPEGRSATHTARGSLAKTPYFQKPLLSGNDSGRNSRIKAQSWLRRLGEKRDRPE